MKKIVILMKNKNKIQKFFFLRKVVTVVVVKSSPNTRHYCGHGRHRLPTPLWVICKENPQQPSVFILFLYKNAFKKKIKVHLLLLFFK
jgi:hypothetical protein